MAEDFCGILVKVGLFGRGTRKSEVGVPADPHRQGLVPHVLRRDREGERVAAEDVLESEFCRGGPALAEVTGLEGSRTASCSAVVSRSIAPTGESRINPCMAYRSAPGRRPPAFAGSVISRPRMRVATVFPSADSVPRMRLA
jgi:hypothetical protein